MSRIPADYLQRVYAGWLGKIIGIRHGAPIEGWTYWKIRDILGEVDSYPVDYREFAADDDSNGPLFFLRGLETAKDPTHMEPDDVAQALLNYAPFEHGFFWWGGYGISTEHTSYLNLRSGVPAPRSGSISQNGAAVAEQIGGQIFIDTWGLVAPGNPDLAARLAQAAASVMHGGNGVYGGIYVAVCISLAFIEKDIKVILRKALDYIPKDCEYARVVNAVMDFHAAHEGGCWRDCFQYIWDNFGYDRYPGHCHIIPNAAVMILSMLYGEGDFIRTINICNMCGWDTDCNVGNVATIMGVLTGLENVDYEKWIRPVHDLLVCSSVVGSLNIMDIPYGASYIAQWAYKLAGEDMPAPMKEIIERSIDGCHFEYEGSTHSIQVRSAYRGNKTEAYIFNSDEQARTGSRSLKVGVPGVGPTEEIFVYKRTHYTKDDFHDSRYDPCFSPLVYPGQKMHASVYIPESGCDVQACLYVRDAHEDRIITGESVNCEKGKWYDLTFDIPAMKGASLDEAGVCFRVLGEHGMGRLTLQSYVDDLYFNGQPDYSVELCRECVEEWTPMHSEVSQFTRLKGLLYLENSRLNLTCSDFGEVYTGRYDWKNYEAKFSIAAQEGENVRANFRVQGAMRSYAAGFNGNGKFAILKNVRGHYAVLCEADLAWEQGKTYEIAVRADGDEITACCEGVQLSCRDAENPYLQGAVGVSVTDGSHLCLDRIEIKGNQD